MTAQAKRPRRGPLAWAFAVVLLSSPLIALIWMLASFLLSLRAGHAFGCGPYTHPCAAWYPASIHLLDLTIVVLAVLLGVKVYRWKAEKEAKSSEGSRPPARRPSF